MDDLCQELENAIKKGDLEPEDAVLGQVKEKLGGLRVYGGSHEAIVRAMERAQVTCEQCGRAGNLRRGYGLRTLCDGCNRAWSVRAREPLSRPLRKDSAVTVTRVKNWLLRRK